jgi:3-oxoacyl-[acyl-carrier protein] reductase
MNDTDFSGKCVLVVGGSSGIGNGIAQAFRARGADVEVWGTRASKQDYADTEGSDLTGLAYQQVDVGAPDAIANATLGLDRLDVLVLSQGIVAYKKAEFQRTGWDQVMAVNLDSLIHCSEKFRGPLAQNAGSIVIISSVSGVKANIGNPAYAASKAGAISLTKSLGQAYARDGIRVNGVAPGLVETKLTQVTTENPERLKGALRAIPLRRTGRPEEIAGGVLFLASPLASYICGQTIFVDGGMTL